MEHLIPEIWFVDLHWLLLLVIGVVSLALLVKGADWLVEGASGIAIRLGISKVIVGATIVSLGTTSPEAAVSVMAAFEGNAGLALGNGVGSIIADTGLIFGIGCLMIALPVDRFILNRQGWVQVGSAVVLAAFCYAAYAASGQEATLDRWVGFVLLAALAWYLWASVRWGRQRSAMADQPVEDEADQTIEHASQIGWPGLIGRFLIGLALVLLFGHVLIQCVTIGAKRAGVPDVVLASTIVALGTSLPELMVCITAIRKGHPALLIGNVVGADVLNVLFVIGASAAAKPLPIIDPNPETFGEIFLVLHLPTMLLILLLFRVFIFSANRRGSFARWNGVPLLAIYVAYLVLNAVLGRPGGH